MPKFKAKLISLKDNEQFKNTIKKLILGEDLKHKEKVFILSCALLLLSYLQHNKKNHEQFEELNNRQQLPIKQIKDRGHKTKKQLREEIKQLSAIILDNDTECRLVRELAYYIIVRYSTHYNDYRPLYDFAANLGLYPICRYIFNSIDVDKDHIKLNHVFTDIHTSFYEEGESKVLTFEQKEYTEELLKNDARYKAYIAPTSYGKSEFISQIISKTDVQSIAVISPTKILVRQNGQMIKEFLRKSNSRQFRLIYHPDMYQDNTPTIASFTQERGLKFLKEYPEKYFDYVIIDEAHELFANNSRSHLLEIFKQKNKNRNFMQQVLYLSPVVEDPNVFKNTEINNDPPLFSKKIKYSLKELDIYYYKDEKGFKYNRFLDELYPCETYNDENDYIFQNARDKNLIFITNPREIEQGAQALSLAINNINHEYLNQLSKMLQEEVHEQFYLANYIKSGVVYLHGHLPDDIREYIVVKFKDASIPIKYLVANTVVLSGANFPVDNLFIKNMGNRGKNDLINLIGRVNRLAYIFNPKNKNLKKLLAPVHFLDSPHEDKNGKVSYPLETKMKHLKSLIFEDDIKNDLLNPEPIRGRKSEKTFNEELKRYQKNNLKKEILVQAGYSRKPEDPLENEDIKQLLYLYDLQNLYIDTESHIPDILSAIKSAEKIDKTNNLEAAKSAGNTDKTDNLESIFNLINHIFFIKYQNQQYNEIFYEFNIARLRYELTRKYYIGCIKAQRASLREQINREIEYYKGKAASSRPLIYIGEYLGEEPYTEGQYTSSEKNVAINLENKSDAELANIAISKIHIEREFISFQLHKFFGFLYDVNLLSIDVYNELVYGSTDSQFIKLVKQGLPISVVNILSEDKILEHIAVGDFAIVGKPSYIEYYNKVSSDLLKFTLDQYIDRE